MWWSVTNSSCTQPIPNINMHFFFNSSVLNIKNELYLYQLVSVVFTDTVKLLESISYCNTNVHLIILFCVCVCKSYMAEIMKIHTHPLGFLSVYMLEKNKTTISMNYLDIVASGIMLFAKCLTMFRLQFSHVDSSYGIIKWVISGTTVTSEA